MANLCPACGYDGLFEPPWLNGSPSNEICPCCGIQFGYDDALDRPTVYERWRDRWIGDGMKWWSTNGRPQPDGWTPLEQLKRFSDATEM